MKTNIQEIKKFIKKTVELQLEFDEMLDDSNDFSLKDGVNPKKASRIAAKLYFQFDEIYNYIQDSSVLEVLRNNDPEATKYLEDYLNDFYINYDRGLYLYYSYFGSRDVVGKVLDLTDGKGKFYSVGPIKEEKLYEVLDPLQYALGFQYIMANDVNGDVTAIGICSYLPAQINKIDEFVKTNLGGVAAPF